MNYSFFNKIAVLLLVASSTYARRRPRVHPRGRAALRVYDGYNDTDGRYPYVVALVSDTERYCTGSLITSNWVLTAAHCHQPEVVAIQYGDMTVPPEQSITKRKILKFIKPYMSIQREMRGKERIKILKNVISRHDIALMRVEEVRMGYYGRISSVNYKALMGLSVEYAGYGGSTLSSWEEIVLIPLQLGAGVVSPCPKILFKNGMGPFICVSQRCGTAQNSLPGDSGGPLVYDGKIVGVTSMKYEIMAYSPVSFYLEWMQNTMAAYIDEN